MSHKEDLPLLIKMSKTPECSFKNAVRHFNSGQTHYNILLIYLKPHLMVFITRSHTHLNISAEKIDLEFQRSAMKSTT